MERQFDGSKSSQLFGDVPREPSLSGKVAQRLLDVILTSGMSVGDQLPSEQALAEKFHVSRTVIREAIRALAAKGVVDVRTGRGLEVTAVSEPMVSELLGLFIWSRDLDYDKVHEVRLLIEVHVAGLAAVRATDSDVANLAALHEKMSLSLDDLESSKRADLEFHRAIAAIAQNDLYLVLLDSMIENLMGVRADNLASGYGDAALAQHAAILTAISAGSPDAARAAMETHLEGVVQHLKMVSSEARVANRHRRER